MASPPISSPPSATSQPQHLDAKAVVGLRHELQACLIIARTTVLESLRNKLLYVGVLFALVLVGLSVAAASITFGERGRIILNVGLAAMSGLGSIMAIALTIHTFASELKHRTAHPVLARPIARWAFVGGKYLGSAATMVMVVAVMLAGVSATVVLHGSPLPGAFWAAAWLSLVQMLAVCAIAILFSTLAIPVLAASYSGGVVLAGSLAGDMYAISQDMILDEHPFGWCLKLFYYVLPDLDRLSLRTQAANGLSVAPLDIVGGTLYGWLYSLLAVVIAAIVFERRKMI